MADRSLRGMRLGAQSLQSDEGVVLVDHQLRTYQTEEGDRFVVTFAGDAEAPEVWEDPKTGAEGRLIDTESGEFVPYEAPEIKPQRTHWDMLLERRTAEELEEVLQIRLDYLRERRGTKDRREPTAGRPQTTGRSTDAAPEPIEIEGRARAQTKAEKEAAARAEKKRKAAAKKKK
nr:RNA polymerase-binding protein RbpA [Pseudoclavibacter sp. Marseille-Q3772]